MWGKGLKIEVSLQRSISTLFRVWVLVILGLLRGSWWLRLLQAVSRVFGVGHLLLGA